MKNIYVSGEKDFKIVCYYGAWSVYRKEPFNFGVQDIDPFTCTHLIYSFAGLNVEDLTMVSLDNEEDIIKGKGVGRRKKNQIVRKCYEPRREGGKPCTHFFAIFL